MPPERYPEKGKKLTWLLILTLAGIYGWISSCNNSSSDVVSDLSDYVNTDPTENQNQEDPDEDNEAPDDISEICNLPEGSLCNPVELTFPFYDTRDTRNAPSERFDFYSCSPETDESGPEYIYRFQSNVPGVLTAQVAEDNMAGYDMDLHLLADTDQIDPDQPSCIIRAHKEFTLWIEPGSYLLIVDTYVSEGVPQSGPFELKVGFVPAPEGNCAMTTESIELQWGTLGLPTTGSVVKEAHMVTTSEVFDDNGWPDNATDGLSEHIELSGTTTGFLATRQSTWCPFGEGGSMWGQGSTIKPPLEYEAWYICMYWVDRPEPGTRMIVTNPQNGYSVVAIAGYETGPGSSERIAGVVEEVHMVLESDHGSELTIGFAEDQTLQPGPITCTE